MNQLHNIPQIEFDKNQFDKKNNQIVINLNNHLWLHRIIENYLFTHRRLIPTIHVKSPSGNIKYFECYGYDNSDIIYRNKNLVVRLTFV